MNWGDNSGRFLEQHNFYHDVILSINEQIQIVVLLSFQMWCLALMVGGKVFILAQIEMLSKTFKVEHIQS